MNIHPSSTCAYCGANQSLVRGAAGILMCVDEVACSDEMERAGLVRRDWSPERRRELREDLQTLVGGR